MLACGLPELRAGFLLCLPVFPVGVSFRYGRATANPARELFLSVLSDSQLSMSMASLVPSSHSHLVISLHTHGDTLLFTLNSLVCITQCGSALLVLGTLWVVS